MSRSDILREAIVETQMKEMRCKPGSAGYDGMYGTGKGEKRDREMSSGNESNTDSKKSYVEAADGEGEWTGVSYAKKKKGYGNEPVMELLGAKENPCKDIFVIGLDYSRCKRPDQLERMVKHYCSRRGVEVMYAKAYKMQSDPNRANCRISINESNTVKVLDDDFWPQFTYARYWYSNNQTANGRSSDDEQTD